MLLKKDFKTIEDAKLLMELLATNEFFHQLIQSNLQTLELDGIIKVILLTKDFLITQIFIILA